MSVNWFGSLLLAALVCLGTGGCASLKRMTVNKLGDALAGGGTAFASDDDPDLVKAAVPFCLKLMESLLAESPRHEGLLLASSRGVTQYSYAFVQQDAEELEEGDVAASLVMRQRARRLYLDSQPAGFPARAESIPVDRGLFDGHLLGNYCRGSAHRVPLLTTFLPGLFIHEPIEPVRRVGVSAEGFQRDMAHVRVGQFL